MAGTAQTGRSLSRGLLAHNLGGKSTTTHTQTNLKLPVEEMLSETATLWISAQVSLTLVRFILHLSVFTPQFLPVSPCLSHLKVLSKPCCCCSQIFLKKTLICLVKIKVNFGRGQPFVGQLVRLPRWSGGGMVPAPWGAVWGLELWTFFDLMWTNVLTPADFIRYWEKKLKSW